MSDRRERLEAARDLAASTLVGLDGDKLAPLLREYRAILAELDALPNTAEVSDADEIAARRAARRAGSPSTPRTKRSR